MEYVKDFKEWALEQYKEYRNRPKYIQANVDGSLTMCACIDFKEKKTSFAKCHPDDQFDPKIGIGVAYAKLMGREIPRELKFTLLKNLSTGDHFISLGVHYIVIGRSSTDKNGYICEQKDTFNLRYFHVETRIHKIS